MKFIVRSILNIVSFLLLASFVVFFFDAWTGIKLFLLSSGAWLLLGDLFGDEL